MRRLPVKTTNTLKQFWKEFRIRTLGKYTGLYNEVDVFQLADVFPNFRDKCMENYKLDPAWYYTSPGLAWDAMLKRTGISLELLTDIDILLTFKDGIRGGVAMASNRLGQANNKYIQSNRFIRNGSQVAK